MKAPRLAVVIIGTVVIVLCSILAYDYWNNNNHYYLRSGDQGDSRLEVYQGKLGSPDFFQQRKFLMETPYLRKQLEPDRCVSHCEIPDFQELITTEISQLPLLERISSYIDSAQFDKAFDLIDKTLQSNNQESGLKAVKLLGKININKALPRLIDKIQNSPSPAVRTAVKENMPIVATRTLFNAKSIAEWGGLENRDIINYLALHTDWVKSDDDFYLLINLILQYTSDETVFFDGSDIAFQIFIATSGSGDIRARAFLREALKNQDKEIRRAAVLVLGQLKDVYSLPVFINKLVDSDFNVKGNAIKALTLLSSEKKVKPDLVNQIIEKITNDDFTDAHIELLSKIASSESLQTLISVLSHKDIAVRVYAVKGIYKLSKTGIRSEKSIFPLIERLSDSFDEIQANASFSLAELNAKEAIQPLINNLSSLEEYTRYAATCSLGKLKAKQALPFLLKALFDKNSRDIRNCATKALLKETHSPDAIQAVINALDNDNPVIRSIAVEAMVEIRDPKVLPLLMSKLTDNNENVRKNAAEALGKLKATEALKPLIHLLKDKDAQTRGLAARALGQLRMPEAIEPLIIQLLEDKDNFPKAEAVSALGQINTGLANKPIQMLINSEDSYLQNAAIKTLGGLKVNEATQRLMKKLGDLSSNAEQALGKLKAKEATSSLLQVFMTVNDLNAKVIRSYAAKSLGEIGSLKALEPLLLHIYDNDWMFDPSEQSRIALQKIAKQKGYKWLEDWLKQFEPSSKQNLEMKTDIEKVADNIKRLSQQQLLALINKTDALQADRIVALETLVKKKPEQAKLILLKLLKNKQNEVVFSHQLIQLIAELKVDEALPLMKQRLSEQEKAWQMWREQRDRLPEKPTKPKIIVSAYSYAEAIARISPEEGIKLLQNSLFDARRGGWEGLARLADVELLKKLNQLRKDNIKNTPLRHALYRAIDLSLIHIDANSSKQDCIALDNYLDMLKKEQRGSLSHDSVALRIEWTRDRIDETLESISRSKWRIQNWSKPFWPREKYHYSHCYSK